MGFAREHELHRRRFGRNVGIGVVLGLFVAVVFGLTIAKVSANGPAVGEGFDHVSPPAQGAAQ